MPPAAQPTSSVTADDQGWPERGEYWLKKIHPAPQYRARKRRIIHRPLVLSGHGIRLNVEQGTLLIKCGFTHYPQKREEYRFFPNDRQLPSRVVILDGDGSITFDAIEWLSAQGVSLVQIDWQGEVVSLGGASYAANQDLIKHQLDAQHNGNGFEFAKWLVLRKLVNSCETLKHVAHDPHEVQPFLEKIKKRIDLLRTSPPEKR